jgi:hypothetical protein
MTALVTDVMLMMAVTVRFRQLHHRSPPTPLSKPATDRPRTGAGFDHSDTVIDPVQRGKTRASFDRAHFQNRRYRHAIQNLFSSLTQAERQRALHAESPFHGA